MRRITNFIIMILFSGVLLMSSCEKKDFTSEDFYWKDEVKVFITPTDNQGLFYATNQKEFEIDEIEYKLSISKGAMEDYVPEFAEIYAFVIDSVDGNPVILGGEEGQLIAEINDFDGLEGYFTVKVDKINAAYGAELQEGKLTSKERIQLKYVLSDADGHISDTRIDCYGGNCQDYVRIDKGLVCEDDFSGVYNYEVIEKGLSSGDGTIGATGQITIEQIALNGVYQVSDAYWGQHGGGSSMELYDKDCSYVIGLQKDNSVNPWGTAWEFTNYTGTTVDVIVTDYWWGNYVDLWGGYFYFIVRVSRADGQTIPDFTGEFERMINVI